MGDLDGAQPGVSVRDGEGLQAGGGEAVQRQDVGSCDDYRVVRRAEESRDVPLPPGGRRTVTLVYEVSASAKVTGL
ncbi:hypothetical protein OG298_02560 [Streptomyces sp. NBC_01005]|uniref:hypothetical protein n=1 Tax=unclassified Streptomyces TaxID=2593676 RepID=UPI00386A9D33|nr:hypothetical protein OG298_02560 [Streptomyces sp. NBC_01005]WTC92821.1 hypothetical protein OH736_02545 [Streptomyces sp. NBC_01650]